MLASDQRRASLFTIREEEEWRQSVSHALVDQIGGFVCDDGVCVRVCGLLVQEEKVRGEINFINEL